MKTVYLVMFMATAFLFLSKLTSEPMQFLGRQPSDGFDWAYGAYVAFFSLLVLHFLRMYLTLEMLEDPQTDLHKTCIPRIVPRDQGWGYWVASHIVRFFEQLVRAALVALVGFKAVSLLGKIEIHGPTIGQLSELSLLTDPVTWVITAFEFGIFNVDHSLGFVAYLFLVYFILLIWDIVILTGGALAGRFGEVFWEDWAFLLANLFGIIVTAAMLLAAEPETRILVLGVLVFAYSATFVADMSINWRDYEETIFLIGRNIVLPYYGLRCTGSSPENCVCAIANIGAGNNSKWKRRVVVLIGFVVPVLLCLVSLIGLKYFGGLVFTVGISSAVAFLGLGVRSVAGGSA